jgi:hypothetical protein
MNHNAITEYITKQSLSNIKERLLICAKPVSNLSVDDGAEAGAGAAHLTGALFGDTSLGVGVQSCVGAGVGLGVDLGVASTAMKGSTYSDTGLGAVLAAGAAKMTGAVVGFTMRGPEGRSHGQRVVRVRLGVVLTVFSTGFSVTFAVAFSVPFSAALPVTLHFIGSFPFSFSFSFSLPDDVGLAPAIVPDTSFLVYPKSESPSTELCLVKFGMDLTGLVEREFCVVVGAEG